MTNLPASARRVAIALTVASAIAFAFAAVASAEDASGAEATADTAAAATPSEADDGSIAAIDKIIETHAIDTTKSGWKSKLPKPTQVEFDPKKKYYWNLETSLGTMKVRLMPEVAPMHVTSTIYLTRLRFYDGTPFHRIITQFMAQGGDPLGRGTGGPGYSYGGEYDPKVKHDRPGLLSMANTGRPNTDGSQFFLTFVPTPHLNGKHTIFGEIIEGMATLREIEKRGSRSGKPSESVVLKRATISVE